MPISGCIIICCISIFIESPYHVFPFTSFNII